MQWGQIKLLFILSFLILDLFLLQQFLSKQAEDELGQISTVAESVETDLQENDITVAEDAIPDNLPEASEIVSKSNSAFSEEIMSQIEEIDDSNQQIELDEDRQVVKVTLEEPIEVTEDTLQDEVDSLIPFSSQYSYWGWNEDEGAAMFFQAVDNQTVYFNKGGLLLVNIEDSEITGYVASLLSFSDEESSMNEFNQSDVNLEPLNAIRTLLENGYIQPGDEVTSMDIGYHTSFDLAPGEENGSQVFTSTWKVTVNGERNHFVYALYGTVIENIDEASFISDIKRTYDFENPMPEQTSFKKK
ncbi:Two-component signal transduction system YycFG, regulatory protein YycI [Halobacillus dabanensis]|uniref:Two-component signal transduction system YycFG, regulatory protein YycI n=1 Tax=Halobacillus dabanensis TaxID=240302 RepID=A0A1I3WU23_HALDA|nr:two-component system regulatory protein YycI [Halobacillus dabanensis]SFK10357.1 Two-component signal transduction system YycFG, regulatory protein YycI [Halobacillus dabanensis]